MTIPAHPDLIRVTSQPEFNNLVEHVKRELQVSIVPSFKRATGGSPVAMNGSMPTESPTETKPSPTVQEYMFKFRCQRSNTDFLPTARELLEQFLTKHHVFGGTSPTTSNVPLTASVSGSGSSSGAAGTAAGTTATTTSGQGTSVLHRRTDSFADAFPHFESRVLASNVGTASGGFGSVLGRTRGHGQFLPSPDFL